jgi:glycosyltransferase involved in cell wall biosynthesis
LSPSAASPGSPPSLAIVVPVFNEAATIEAGVRQIAAIAGRYPGEALVIAVDDGSADESAAILERLATELALLRVERHAANAGYGVALRTGTAAAAALGIDYVAFIDSDLTNPPEDLLRIGELAAAGHEYIKASRFVRGGRMEGVPAARAAVSVAGNAVGRLLFGTGVRDVTNGFRAARTELLCSWTLTEPGFAVIVEELDWALRNGVEPVEFPTVLRSRTTEQRPTAFAYSPRLVLTYLRYPMRAFGRRLRRWARR